MSYADRVAAGDVFLREMFGNDYAERIDLDTLDLGHNMVCVIAQVTGGFYGQWVTEFEKSPNYVDPITLGFIEPPDIRDTFADRRARYDRLTRAWREFLLDGVVSSPDLCDD